MPPVAKIWTPELVSSAVRPVGNGSATSPRAVQSAVVVQLVVQVYFSMPPFDPEAPALTVGVSDVHRVHRGAPGVHHVNCSGEKWVVSAGLWW